MIYKKKEEKRVPAMMSKASTIRVNLKNLWGNRQDMPRQPGSGIIMSATLSSIKKTSEEWAGLRTAPRGVSSNLLLLLPSRQ